MTRKVFCVGFQKTGTSSLARALRMLGYSVAHNPPANVSREVDWAKGQHRDQIFSVLQSLLDDHDVLQDSPMAFFAPDFDIAYPNSKFILTVRAPDRWLNSYRNYFPDHNNALRRWMYGVPRFSGNETIYKKVFEDKNAEIITYFSGRSDLLIMNLEAGDGWVKLINFLGKDLDGRFPHLRAGKKPGVRRRNNRSRAAAGVLLSHSLEALS